jgi:hypothetical protein
MDPAILQKLREARDVKLVIDGDAYILLREDLADVVQVNTGPLASLNTFRLSGKVWVIQFDGQESHLPDTPRMRYLHVLLKNQGRSVWCTQIISMARGEISHVFRDEQIRELLENGALNVDPKQHIAVLPPEARRRLLTAIEEIEGEVAALRADGKAEQAMEREEQIAEIKAELQRYQYKGHNVSFANPDTDNRNAVGNGIRRAIKAIRPVNPSLASHLTNSIKLGYECCYQPEKPISWLL